MKLFRKRFIPNENIDISSDEVIMKNDELIVTKWLPIHPRDDIAKGISWTYLNKGFKVSKLFNKDGEFLYYYIDIIDYDFHKDEDKYTIVDLLVDVKIDNDGKINILDMDELQRAFNEGIIDNTIFNKAIERLNLVINIVSNESIESYCNL